MWKKFRKQVLRLPAPFRNVYVLTALLFIVWMLFLDDNNVMVQYRRHSELSSLLEKKEFYTEQTKKTEEAYAELTSNPATQEKFAREHYWMKRDNEDVFVLVEETP